MSKPLMSKPNFIIVGSMKSATSTVFEQLNRQPGIFMSALKEPNFFSDDDKYELGISWYQSLFKGAQVNDLLGEASTHYTKLPTYPNTVKRMSEYCPEAKLVYIMRHPIERLVSQYIHEWSQGHISVPIDQAIHQHRELVNYSRFYYQISKFLANFPSSSIHCMFFERFIESPKIELEGIARFIGLQQEVMWHQELAKANSSENRVKKNWFYRAFIDNRASQLVRRRLVSEHVRGLIKRKFQMKDRPELSVESQKYLIEIFDKDLARLGDLFGIKLNCNNYYELINDRSNTFNMRSV